MGLKQRVGLLMELAISNLRDFIHFGGKFDDIKAQVNAAKQIAYGMNFLHSLRPQILVNQIILNFMNTEMGLASRFEDK